VEGPVAKVGIVVLRGRSQQEKYKTGPDPSVSVVPYLDLPVNDRLLVAEKGQGQQEKE